jgi:hypothetical protein
MKDDEISFEGPPFRTDDICIGTLQMASKASALKAISVFPPIRCAMWAQIDEIGIHFRGVLLDKPEFRQAKNEWVRWDAIKDGGAAAEAAVSEALDRLASQLSPDAAAGSKADAG